MIAFIIFVIVVGALGTIFIGINPKEAKYGTKTKGNLTRLTLFYVVSTIVFMVIFFYFFKS